MAIDDADRRRVILDAALACFLQFGYAKTSLDDIAQRAKISRPLLYRKFKNKEHIFGVCYDRVFTTMYPECERILAGRGSRKTKMTRICDLIIIGPWRLLTSAPMVREFYDACMQVIPEIHAKHEARFHEVCRQLLGDDVTAEVFGLAIDGMLVDLPGVDTLQQRLRVLIDRFL